MLLYDRIVHNYELYNSIIYYRFSNTCVNQYYSYQDNTLRDTYEFYIAFSYDRLSNIDMVHFLIKSKTLLCYYFHIYIFNQPSAYKADTPLNGNFINNNVPYISIVFYMAFHIQLLDQCTYFFFLLSENQAHFYHKDIFLIFQAVVNIYYTHSYDISLNNYVIHNLIINHIIIHN